MKTKHYLSCIIFLLFSFSNWAQSCLPEGITFSTQGQIDSFAINYPGCTEIEGDVKIQESTSNNISNLIGISQIVTIEGNLVIRSNKSLLTLNGLENINSIGESLSIRSNTMLSNITSLQNLFSIGGSIAISSNNELQDLSGLENIVWTLR